MNKKELKKTGIISLVLVTVIYLLFLILPFILTPILNSYTPNISQLIEKTSGFKVRLEKMQIVTTPKFTVGLKINKTEAFLPTNEKFLQVDNFQVKLSLLPILLRKIELDIISADNINLDLKVQKNGKILIENYIPKSKEEPKIKAPTKPFLKLSNHLPNINIDKYKISFIDMQSNKKYSIEGDKTKVSDFIFNKKIKLSGTGKFILNGREQFTYDIKLFNKIMPNIQLNDLVFNPQPTGTKPQEIKFNIIDVFKALYNNEFSANLKSDIKTYGTPDDVRLDGLISVDKLSIFVNSKELPHSNILLKLKGNRIALDSDFFTAPNEITHIKGNFKTGKKPNIDLSFKSNSNLKNILEIAKSVSKSFGINDLQTLSANGCIDADFNIKSNLKKIHSSGYFKIPQGNLYYGLHNISINNINSDISFDNNTINIEKTGFSVLGQPLKIYGTIQQDASVNINVFADRLSIKSILLSLGQISVLRENKFNSGNLTLKTSLTGKLGKPNCLANISIDNLNVKNIPTATSIIMDDSKINITSNSKGIKGNEIINNIRIINPGLVISIPKITETITPTEIIISPASVLLDKIKLIVSGKIKNYLTNKIILDIQTGGNINSKLNGAINPASQKLDLKYSIPTPCMFPIPGFSKSKMQAKGNLSISGSMANPNLNGTFIVPYILLPDMLVSMSDMVVNLNGPILKGNGAVKKITSGGIVVQNLGADFILKKDLFYLNNIIGDAYSGKVKGNVVYNVVNGKTVVDFKGYNMNSTSAIAGVAGIKNAMSGVLDFSTKVAFQGIEYKDIIKSLKGNFSFRIQNGALGKVGTLEEFLNAQNIISNSVMRLALNTVTSTVTVKNTAIFKYIKGDMIFSKGWANISSIKTSGPTMSYYAKGRYNLLNGAANVILLGRLSSDVVIMLGPIGDLSVDKLTSYIPKFGTLTAVIIKSMTTNPAEENVANIPPLSSGDKSYKDFKVVFSAGRVKSFKWLSNVDTSAIDIKSTIKDVKKQFIDVKKSTVEEVKKQYSDVKNSTVNEVKSTVNDTKKQIQDAAGEWKNLLKF